MKGSKYLFFINLGAVNLLLKLSYLYSRVGTIQKEYIYRTKQYQTFYRKINCGLSNFRGFQNGYHQDFQYLIVWVHFFHEVAMLI